jgi:thioredoxin reductase
MSSEVVSIRPGNVSLNVEGEQTTIPNNAVIVQIGGTAPAELLRKFGISVTTKHGER